MPIVVGVAFRLREAEVECGFVKMPARAAHVLCELAGQSTAPSWLERLRFWKR